MLLAISMKQAMGESFWQKESLLQYTMTLLQGPKHPVLPTLINMPFYNNWLINAKVFFVVHSTI